MPLMIHLKNGRDLPVRLCECGKCKNEFYVQDFKKEWEPMYCPFCGIKFIRASESVIDV